MSEQESVLLRVRHCNSYRPDGVPVFSGAAMCRGLDTSINAGYDGEPITDLFNVQDTLLREAAKSEVRETILDAAERLLTRYGYGKMTMSDLAEEAGIGVGTTYLHFPGKAEVALAVVTRADMRVVEEQRKIAASSGLAKDRLREVLTQRVMIRFRNLSRQKHSLTELRAVIRAAIERQNGLREQGLLWREQETQIVVGLLLEGRERGEFEVGDAAGTADAMLWATEAFLPKHLQPEDLELPHLVPGRVQGIVDLLLRAVSSRRAEA